MLIKNPVIFALDVDSTEELKANLRPVIDLIGAVKLGPRLIYKYGASLIKELSEEVPVFVDNKYFDIPSTMVAAVQASFDAGASLVTVHALAGSKALHELAKLEQKLNQTRAFKILAVTILTSWDQTTLPNNFHSWSIENHVRSLCLQVHQSGLRGIVCSGHELELISQNDFFKVVPGIRLSSDVQQEDQKRTMTPKQAIKAGANGLVIGRPILQSRQPRQTVIDILESCSL